MTPLRETDPRHSTPCHLHTHQPITMPALSPTMTHGGVTEWKVTEGSVIRAGDVLCDIETDKAIMALESMEDGVMAKIFARNGTTDLPVGTLLGVMVEDAKDVAAFADYVAPPATGDGGASVDGDASMASSSASSAPASSTSSNKNHVTLPSGRLWPSVRRLLHESGLDGTKISGTGPKGVLVKGDVLAAMGLIDAPSSKSDPSKSEPSVPTRTGKQSAPKTTPTPPPSGIEPETAHDDIPTTAVRKVIASRLLESKTKSPHEYVSVDVRLTNVAALRKKLKTQNVKASVNDCVMYAVSRALALSPKINATWCAVSKQSRFCETVDVAVAVATSSGLITPIVTKANTKSLTKIGEEIRELAGRAREGRLKPSEYTGGSFSVSNLGTFPVDTFAAILNPPQGAIMAVGRGGERVGLDADGAIVGTPTVSITVSSDARVADAADVARFLEVFKQVFENPQGGGELEAWTI